MSEKVLKGYADVIGKHALVISDHAGPASYTTGGETLGRSSAPYKPFLGLRTVDMLLCNDLTISGNYLVQSQSVVGGGGSSAYGKLKWLYASASTGGFAPVASTAITAAGTYTGTTPSVTFSAAPAGGTTATGVAVLNGAGTAVIGILVTNPGSYPVGSPPTITFGAGGATATAALGTAGAVGTEVASGTNLGAETVRIMAIGG